MADADVGLGVGVAGTLSIGWPLSLPGRGLGGAGVSISGKVLHEGLKGLDGGRSHLLQVSNKFAGDQ